MCLDGKVEECESGWKVEKETEYYRESKKKKKGSTIKTVGQGKGNRKRNTSTHRAPLPVESACILRTQEAHRK